MKHLLLASVYIGLVYMAAVSYTMGSGGSFRAGKARLERDADHSPPSSAEVKKEQELYLLSSQAPPRRVAGQLYLYFYMAVTSCVIM
jgi:hypothetical protein